MTVHGLDKEESASAISSLWLAGAPAIILIRLEQRDDNGKTSHEDNFVRIKIFNEEGPSTLT